VVRARLEMFVDPTRVVFDATPGGEAIDDVIAATAL
jgi:hypothetical protein